MRLSPSARPAARLSVLLLLAACQPQARRLLLLDLALSDPVVLNGTARPWVDAGYTVRYRRFYPHLTRGDLPQFRTLVLLLGREPEAPSDAPPPHPLVEQRSEEHTSELQSPYDIVCRLLLEKKKN